MKIILVRLLALGLAATMGTALAFGQQTHSSPQKAAQPADPAQVEKLKQEYADGAAVRSRLVVQCG